MTVRIAVLDDYQEVAHQYADWGSLPGEVTFFHDAVTDRDELVSRLEPFDVIAVMRERTPMPREVLSRLPRLRLLVTTGMRNAAIDVDAAGELGIAVCGTGGPASPGFAATAELTWGLVLSLARAIPAEDRQVREGGWQRTVGIGLAGRVLGLVGLGNLGGQVAAIARAFGMRVLAWSTNLTDEAAAAAGVERVSKDELFRRSDVISVHMVLSERSRGLVSAADIAAMKSTAFLVNTSRGPIVDEEALRSALHDGRIAGAGIDVFTTEPLPADHPWRSTPRTVLTPHLGYVTEETYEVFYPQTVEAVQAFLDGNPVRVIA